MTDRSPANLPNSRIDAKPRRFCNWCDKDKPQARGVEIGTKFKCAMCYTAGMFRKVKRDS